MLEEKHIKFMRDVEDRYKAASGLDNRSQYKIYYCAVQPAEILLLGINPGGDPADITPDGTKTRNGEIVSSSGFYYENYEHDVFDCEWAMNRKIRPFLRNLTERQDTEIRKRVVYTNIAFRRSRGVDDIDIEGAKREAASFLVEIASYVAPRLIILSGAKLKDFENLICDECQEIETRQVEPRINHTVFWPARVKIKGSSIDAVAVQIAHASQFSWTYESFDVANRIKTLVHL